MRNVSQTMKDFPLSRKIILKRTIQATILLIILLVVIYFAGLYILQYDLLISIKIIGILILVVWLVGSIYESAYFNSYFYQLTDRYIIIKGGPIFPREITITYDHIGSVNTEQSFFDKMLGICNLHINLTTNAPIALTPHIKGLTLESANGLLGVINSKIKM